MKKAISEEVIAVLKSGYVTDRSSFKLTAQLDRDLYVKVDKVLKMLGGKWNRKAQAHVFPEDPSDMIEEAVATGFVTDEKKMFQFFPTPDTVIDMMIAYANLQRGFLILEPSAGDGRIIRRINGMFPTLEIDAIELNQKHSDALVKLNGIVTIADFLKVDPDSRPKYDRILMNPPFSKGQDIAHVRHAYKMLRPGGLMVAITLPSWLWRTDPKYVDFRLWFDECRRDSRTFVQELGEGAFSESGTNIRTLLLTIGKPAASK